MANAFFVVLPFTYLTMTEMILSQNLKENDLYLMRVAKDVDQVAVRMEKTGLFRNIYILDNLLVDYPVSLGDVMAVMRKRHKVFHLLKGKSYDNIYYGLDGWLMNSIIYNGLKKKNKTAKHIFIEAGINPYTQGYDDKPWYLRVFINLYGLTCMDGRFVDKRYLFEPSALCVSQTGEIVKLEKVEKGNQQLIEKLKIIFQFEDDIAREFFDKKFIIMEQGAFGFSFDANEFWTKVTDCLPKQQTILKSHPKQKNSALAALALDTCENYTIPWEVYTLLLQMQDKVLLSVFSTACIAPKLVLGEEPRIILLYKLLGTDLSFIGQGTKEFVEKMKDLYKDPTYFFVPETFEELRLYIQKNL